MTAQGDPVLGTNGQPIVVDPKSTIGISRDGRVFSNGALAGTLAVTALQDDSLKKLGDSYVQGTVDPQGRVGTLAQGYLETSNVNSVKQMVDLIVNMRTFEAGQKVVQAIDSTLDKTANQVGHA